MLAPFEKVAIFLAFEYTLNFTDGSYINIVGYSDLNARGETYGFKRACLKYHDFNNNYYHLWEGNKTDLDGHIWTITDTYINITEIGKFKGSGYSMFVYNANEKKFSFSADYPYSSDTYGSPFINSTNLKGKTFAESINFSVKNNPPYGDYRVNLLNNFSVAIYQPEKSFKQFGGSTWPYDDFVNLFPKSLNKSIVNTDPYVDGGSSTTGGGGGSFDGTTEIITEPDTPLVNVSATKFVSLYNPTESQLNNLAYFMWHTLDPTTWIKIVADPMDAIISLSVLPIDIPSSSASEISVGGISTGVSCNLASAQYISFDAGTITVPQYSNSYLDYAPYTTISIYLPYVGLRKIPTDLVMGKVLGVKYRIDIFTGACCVYITVGGSVILQFTGNCAQQIPFTSSNWTQAITTMVSMIGSGVMAVANPATAALSVAGMANSAVNGLHADIETGGANGGNVGFLGVQKPYIIIQRPKQCIPANQNTFTGYPSYITATFGDLKGYTEVDKIILENINATENELNELESLLKGGVYVNEL